MATMTRDHLEACLKTEKAFYCNARTVHEKVRNLIMGGRNVQLWKYVKTLRKLEYYYYNRKKNLYFACMNVFLARRFNKLGLKLGIELERGVFGEGLKIYHTQGIVVNGDSKVGKNCILHGANVIGNMGNDLKAPVLGNNVRLGVGAKVLGDVYVADDVQIGAGALVLHSCYEKGALLIGAPAKPYVSSEGE